MQRRILKMKKLLLYLCCGLVMTSCVNKLDAIKQVEQKFPNSEIYQIYNTDKLLVIDSIGIYVVSLSPFTIISNMQLIKKWQSQ